jgi:Tol biopolymer transport system component
MRPGAITLVAAAVLALAALGRGQAADDTTNILYTHNVRGTVSIWELEADGTDGRELVASASQPTWSPDGTRAAFDQQVAADQSGGTNIATADASGGNVRVLTTSGRAGGPAWSPDGASIAFSQGGGRPGLWVIANDGTGARQLTSPPAGTTDYGPSWSPDGRTIAFTRVTLSPAPVAAAIWTIDVASGSETRLTPADSDGASPAWSPDGTQIAFLSGRDHDGRTYGEDETMPNADIYVMQADGSHPVRITHTRGPEESVAWTPSGRRLLYSTAPASSSFGPYQLVLAKSDGSCPTTLTQGTTWHTDPSASRSGDSDALPLRCALPAPVRPVFLAAAPALAAARMHGGTPAESALARGLLAGLGKATTIRSLTLATPPARVHAKAGSAWLRVDVAGTGTRDAVGAVQPSWEVALLADVYAEQAAKAGLPPLAGLTIHYLGSGQTVSRTEQQRHDRVGSERPNENLSAETIAQTLHAITLPRGAQLSSVRFARLAGIAVPEVVVQVDGTTATGRLYPIYDRLIDPLQLDQGVYLELRGRCGALLGALGSGHLGTRTRIGIAHAAHC